MAFADYLNFMLGQKKAGVVLSMTQQEKKDRPIIISGRQGPTGKSALKKILKKHGYWVLESFECVEVILDKEIQRPVADFASLVD